MKYIGKIRRVRILLSTVCTSNKINVLTLKKICRTQHT